jgi:hypothetical protein
MNFNSFEGKQLEELIDLLEAKASSRSDGHITLMKFGSGWKVFFGTPVLDMRGRDQVGDQINHGDIRTAVISLLNNPQNCV